MLRNFVKVALCVVLFALRSGAAWADGAVYAMTNALGNNQVMMYHRGADGSLITSPVQTINTGGGGSGLQLSAVDSLGSAGSLQLDLGHHLLFAINTESANENNGAGTYNSDCQQGTITSFQVAADGTLTFADRVFSRGLFPDSLTVKRLGDSDDPSPGPDLLYVLNAGGPETAVCNNQPAVSNQPNITAFTVDRTGRMEPLGSVRPIDPGPATGPSNESCSLGSAMGFSNLTGAPAADFQCGLNPPSFVRSPAQIRFTPDGNHLVVTVKGTNTICFPGQFRREGRDPDNRAGFPAGDPGFLRLYLQPGPGPARYRAVGCIHQYPAGRRRRALVIQPQHGERTGANQLSCR
jgi:6-phosphogluconolactonase